jgi:hypothetical protein
MVRLLEAYAGNAAGSVVDLGAAAERDLISRGKAVAAPAPAPASAAPAPKTQHAYQPAYSQQPEITYTDNGKTFYTARPYEEKDAPIREKAEKERIEREKAERDAALAFEARTPGESKLVVVKEIGSGAETVISRAQFNASYRVEASEKPKS